MLSQKNGLEVNQLEGVGSSDRSSATGGGHCSCEVQGWLIQMIYGKFGTCSNIPYFPQWSWYSPGHRKKGKNNVMSVVLEWNETNLHLFDYPWKAEKPWPEVGGMWEAASATEQATYDYIEQRMWAGRRWVACQVQEEIEHSEVT